MKKRIDGETHYFIIQCNRWVETTKEMHDDFYRFVWKHYYNPMKKENKCLCTYAYYCKGDCETCKYYHNTSPSVYDLDAPTGGDDVTEEVEYRELKSAIYKAVGENVSCGIEMLDMMLESMTIGMMAEKLGISTASVHRRRDRIRREAQKVVDEFYK